MKQVRETAAGKSISAWVILKDGKQIAQVHAHYGNSKVTVDIWSTPNWELQQSWASGYGYDKFTAALSGMTVDGHTLYNHSHADNIVRGIVERYHNGSITEREFKNQLDEIGASPANWQTKTGKYESAYYDGGLDRLKSLGYLVIQAI